jgi:hypothetical protein
MQATITTSEIMETTTYKNLGKMFQNLLIKFSSRQQITYGINVHANTGEIPIHLGSNTLKIVKELIESKRLAKHLKNEQHGWYDESKEDRMNIIGQNGNDGEHYENETKF